MGTATCVDIILAILLPPLGVFFKYGCKVLSLLSLLCGVLDLSVADHIGVHPWNPLCSLCPHQVNKPPEEEKMGRVSNAWAGGC
ncbi:hypothetical protein RHSIM_Rhsim11G0105800 [Rhododendron simsii]|uniref:Uncharacterized protein n=1 Tax=Rhododendron simsii TaxID=118357 RepID=A0A834LA86_RHOSS|nr:hypothetical protein RHSIM_Rhsim11G0105800 [Rhododendron simsii]